MNPNGKVFGLISSSGSGQRKLSQANRISTIALHSVINRGRGDMLSLPKGGSLLFSAELDLGSSNFAEENRHGF